MLVGDSHGVKVGVISDLAIVESSGLLAYTALAERVAAAGKFHAVPLSAYLAKPGERAWQLDLPAESVGQTKTFSADHWPSTMDRGWLEYVHVNYGRSTFDGVRTVGKSAANPGNQTSRGPN